jgi:hypothetical protein
LEYVAPTPNCASNDAFQALVKAEIARFPGSDRNRRLSVRIVQQDGLYASTLTTETGAVRTITAARCDDVTAALAVIIAVAEPSGAPPPTRAWPGAQRGSLACGPAFAPQFPLRLPEIASVLEVQPELRGRAERLRQEQGGLGRHGAASLNDAVHDLNVETHLLGQCGLAHSLRFEPLLFEHLTRERGRRQPM